MDTDKSKILCEISKKLTSIVSPEKNLGIGHENGRDDALAERHK